jgi:hypothetical protein
MPLWNCSQHPDSHRKCARLSQGPAAPHTHNDTHHVHQVIDVDAVTAPSDSTELLVGKGDLRERGGEGAC